MNNTNSNVVGYYDKYLCKILDVARLTTKDNSVLISFSINDSKCNSKVELLEQDGTKSIEMNVNFACTESFYDNFLEKLVLEYSDIVSVVVTDIIDIDGDNLFTFRMVGESNDLFSVDGISSNYAKKLKEIVTEGKDIALNKEKTLIKTTDEAGISNTFGLLILVLMGIVIILSWIVFI